MLRPAIAGLYALTPDLLDTDLLTERVAAAISGGATAIQYRNKLASPPLKRAQALVLRDLCSASNAIFIVNDDVDLAYAVDADGVHLGQDDLPLQAARALAPPSFLVGVSTHSEPQARAALGEGADYIGFGPVFATQTKENPDPVVGLSALATICRLPIPVVAIGGITVENAAQVARAGAAAAATISATCAAADPTFAAAAMIAAFAQGTR